MSIWLHRVIFGSSLAAVASVLLLLLFASGWSVEEPGPDADFSWGIAWLATTAATLLWAVPSAFLVGRWKALSAWWAPAASFLFLAVSLSVAGVATGLLCLWLLE